MRKGDIGAPVTQLQRQLITAGLKLTADGVFGDDTEAALIAFQRRTGLVADGIAGPKTLAALASRDRDPKHLAERDLEQAADRLGVPVAAIKAVNEVETAGRGYLDDGRPVILFERHVLYRLLGERGIDPRAARRPLPQRAQPPARRLRRRCRRMVAARQCLPDPAGVTPACRSRPCSWGQYQIMGYHWQHLGYDSVEAFVAAMRQGEAQQLDAFAPLRRSRSGTAQGHQRKEVGPPSPRPTTARPTAKTSMT